MCAFNSESVLQMRGIGDLTFDLLDPITSAKLGEVEVSDFSVRTGHNTHPSSARLFVSAANGTAAATAQHKALQTFMAKFAAGQDNSCVMRGPTRAASPLLLNLLTAQIVTIQADGPFLSEVTTSGIQISGGTVHTLHAAVSAEFHSATTVSRGALGATRFEVLDTGHRRIGSISMPSSMAISPGANGVVAAAEFSYDGTNATKQSITRFVGTYLHGDAQQGFLAGPVGHPIAFMNNILQVAMVAKGTADSALMLGGQLTQEALTGIPPPMSPNAPSEGKFPLMRGFVMEMRNPMNITVVVTKMYVDAYLHEPIAFEFKNDVWLGPFDKPYVCPLNDHMGTLEFKRGMATYPDLCPDPKKCSVAQHNISIAPNGVTATFVPTNATAGAEAAKPHECPGIAKAVGLVPKTGCCWAPRFWALACRAFETGQAQFLARGNGTLSLLLGKFQLDDVPYSQNNIPMSFTNKMLHGGDLATGCLQCKDFQVTGLPKNPDFPPKVPDVCV
jgi:hypothetical protein